MKRRYSGAKTENANYGKFEHVNGFGSSWGMQRALNRYLSHKAMFEGEAFACESFRHSDYVNVYGVGTQVLPVHKSQLRNTARVLNELANKQEGVE